MDYRDWKYSWDGMISEKYHRLAVGLLLGIVLLSLESNLYHPGFSYYGDGISNLFPALHARWSLAHGRLPIYTHLWYGGRYQFMNPLWKGLYPPAWILFIPGIPLIPAQKFLLILHYLAVPIIAYWFAREDFEPAIAIPFALAFAMPMAVFNGQMEKVLAWPWLTLLVWQLTKTRLDERPRHTGLLIGISIGMTLLCGAMYYFFYALVLVAPMVIARRDWTVVRHAMVGSLVGVPKIALSIIPVMLTGAGRPAGGKSLTVKYLISGLVGFWFDASKPALLFKQGILGEGYAAIGLPLCLLGGVAFLYGYLRPEVNQSRWLLGVAGAGFSGFIIAIHGFVYKIPGVSIFRVAARAEVIIALSLLLASWYTLWLTQRYGTDLLRGIVAVVVVLSVFSTTVSWVALGGASSVPADAGSHVADKIISAGCENVWIEGSFQSSKPPLQKSIAYHLYQNGIATTAINYGKIGQDYTAVDKSGRPTFDVLLIGKRITSDEITLTGGWGSPDRGTVSMSKFSPVEVVQTSEGPLYMYRTTNGNCSA